MQALEDGSPDAAAREAIARIRRSNAIVLDPDGRPGIAHSDHFAIGFVSRDVAPRAGIRGDDLKDVLDE